MPKLWTLHAYCHEHQVLCHHFDEPPGRLLDVGCTGSDVPLVASGLGFDATGIDLRPYAESMSFRATVPLGEGPYPARITVPVPEWPAHITHGDASFTFIHGDLFVLDGVGPFDVIVAMSSIEHFGLPHEDSHTRVNMAADAEAMAKIAELLVPGGTVYLMVPAAANAFIFDDARYYDVGAWHELAAGFIVGDEWLYQFNTDPEAVNMDAWTRRNIARGEIDQYQANVGDLTDSPYSGAVWLGRLTKEG